jgi:peptidyl-tRNA hydrolase
MSVDESLVQYYVALRGQFSDSALALLAARGALLGQARWSARDDYRRWRRIMMTKVALEGTPEDLERIRAATETIPLRADGREAAPGEPPALLVLPPLPKAVAAPLLGHLRLAAKRRGRLPDSNVTPVLLLIAAGDLGIHGGKLAAQAAHGALRAESAYGTSPSWAEWQQIGAPLALRRATSDDLAALAAQYPASAIRDAGFTQIAAGSLTVVAIPPGDPDAERLLRKLEPW